MEYLSENDNSLTESLWIASEYGFECWKLNSETLASILKSRNNEEDYQEFLKELEKEIDDLV
jgi:endo-beta-N-acetylglucosaminidase D